MQAGVSLICLRVTNEKADYIITILLNTQQRNSKMNQKLGKAATVIGNMSHDSVDIDCCR